MDEEAKGFPARWGKGKSPHKFYYTYQDLADILGISIGTIRNLKSQGRFNPKSFESVFDFLLLQLGVIYEKL